ncbi:MAG TPA: GNAT family N-acetyltransferase [Coleofasciculaceae cyanobacterium]|jgi:CelD/BcsL family acetyltransferase involved in cellulose biosynthesis
MTTQLLEPANRTAPSPEATAQPPLTASGSYRAVLISDLSAFEALDGQWDDFLRETGTHNLCLTHAWLSEWLRHFPPEQLLVIIITDEAGRWVGVAPFMIRKSLTGLTHRLLRHVQFIGTHPTVYDWMKIVTHPQASESAVLDTIAETLRQTHWDVLDLMFMPDPRPLELLGQKLKLGTPSQAIRETMSIPALSLPATEEEFAKTRRKKTRLEVNRHCNRFESEFGNPPQLEFQSGTDETNASLARFFAGHIQYWAERGQKSDFRRFPNLYGFYKRMLAHAKEVHDPAEPKLLFSVLKIADYQLSYHLGFWQGNCYLSHITNFNQSFRSYSPGTIHMDKLVFETIRRRGVEFEMGRGDEPYKKMWAKDKKTLWSLRLFHNPITKSLWQIDILLKRLMRKPVE